MSLPVRLSPGLSRVVCEYSTACIAAVHDHLAALVCRVLFGHCMPQDRVCLQSGQVCGLGIGVQHNCCCRDGWGCLCNSLSGSTRLVMVRAAACICGHRCAAHLAVKACWLLCWGQHACLGVAVCVRCMGSCLCVRNAACQGLPNENKRSGRSLTAQAQQHDGRRLGSSCVLQEQPCWQLQHLPVCRSVGDEGRQGHRFVACLILRVLLQF